MRYGDRGLAALGTYFRELTQKLSSHTSTSRAGAMRVYYSVLTCVGGALLDFCSSATTFTGCQHLQDRRELDSTAFHPDSHVELAVAYLPSVP